MMRYIQRGRPAIVCFENVPDLLLRSTGNWDALVGAFRALGYEVHGEVLCSSDYGLNQSRRRVYGVAAARALFDNCEASTQRFLHNVFQLASRLKLPVRPLQTWLLPEPGT